MRNRSLIVASIATLLTLAGSAQSIPDAPQPQKKPAPKAPASDRIGGTVDPNLPPPPADNAPPADAKPAAKDDNAFPEAVSKAAAKQAAQETPNDTPQQTPAPAGKPHSTGDDNPFPEAESKAAAKAAGDDRAPKSDVPPRSDLPPGMSSSQSSSADEEPAKAPPVVNDPAAARKDAEVGTFYLKDGNVRGALLRYQEASAADPTNIDAIFGMAEAQRLLGKKDEAVRDYQMYLDIVPNGPKAKEAMKALKVLQASK
jgi:tetratricopeptide (TPR) repeat protein